MTKRYLPLFTIIMCFAVIPFFGLSAAELWNKGGSQDGTTSKGTAAINPGSLKSKGQSAKYSNSDSKDAAEDDNMKGTSVVRTIKNSPMIVGRIPDERFSVSKSLSGPVAVRKMVSSRVEEFMLSGAMKGRMTDVQNALLVERDTRKAVREGIIQMRKDSARIKRENAKKHQKYVEEFKRRKNMTNAQILAENQRLYDAVLRDKEKGAFEAMGKREFDRIGLSSFISSSKGERVSKTRAVSLYNKSR